MAKLGSDKRPAIVRVNDMRKAEEVVAICNEHGWQVIVGVEPGEPQKLHDIKWLLNRKRISMPVSLISEQTNGRY